jgi:hypothetical protein
MGTVKYYARKADPERFRAITAKYTNMDGHVNFEQGELRDYFLAVFGDNLLCCNGVEGKWDRLFYIWREERSVWTCDDGTALRYDIFQQCMSLMQRNKEMWVQRYTEAHDNWLAIKASGGSVDEVRLSKVLRDEADGKLKTLV